jgi:hypothetical protein
MLCKLGCGLLGLFQRKNGFYYCSNHNSKCPALRKKVGEKQSVWRSGKTYEEIYGVDADKIRSLRGEKLKGRQISDEQKKKISDSNKKTKALKPSIPWNKGLKGSQVPWNKGLKKAESLEILERNDPIYSDFKKYRNRVAVRTRKTYKLHESIINPNNLKLGKCGVDGAHQIDHIITVRQGFEQGHSVEMIASLENLRVIPWLENIQKYDGKGLRKNSRLQ